jgi:hypothetical protein
LLHPYVPASAATSSDVVEHSTRWPYGTSAAPHVQSGRGASRDEHANALAAPVSTTIETLRKRMGPHLPRAEDVCRRDVEPRFSARASHRGIRSLE